MPSSIAESQVMELLKLTHKPQEIKIRISRSVELGFEPEGANEVALIHLDDKGVVVSLDEDYIEHFFGDEPNVHAYRPIFIPWCHVYGIWAYRAT